jgi:hypothetical protein
MTHKEAIEAGKLMIAWGQKKVKRVQCRIGGGLSNWVDSRGPCWNWAILEFRAAPTSLRRTYTASEAVGLVGKEVAETLDGFVFVVDGVDVRRASQPMVLLKPTNECWTERRISVELLLQRYNFLDGSPCGVEVEE